LQWDNNSILKDVPDKLKNKDGSDKILFFSDADEGNQIHQLQVSLDSIIKKNPSAPKTRYISYPAESHISVPVKAFYDGIRHIYPGWHLPYSTSAFRQTMSSDIIIKHYQQLSATYRYNVIPPQDEINQISRFLANDPNRIKDAIELLTMNEKNHPASAIIPEILGDTYMKIKDPEKALKYYQKALTLDSNSSSLKQKIAAIK
jgi:hypothetical protein